MTFVPTHTISTLSFLLLLLLFQDAPPLSEELLTIHSSSSSGGRGLLLLLLPLKTGPLSLVCCFVHAQCPREPARLQLSSPFPSNKGEALSLHQAAAAATATAVAATSSWFGGGPSRRKERKMRFLPSTNVSAM